MNRRQIELAVYDLASARGLDTEQAAALAVDVGQRLYAPSITRKSGPHVRPERGYHDEGTVTVDVALPPASAR